MARPVVCRIIDQPDGRFAISAQVASGKMFVRKNLTTPAEVDDALDVLRHLLAACGSELVLNPAHGVCIARAVVSYS